VEKKDDNKAYINFLGTFVKYQEIINVLKENKCDDGLCRVSQKEIGSKVKISQALVSKCLIRLEKSDKCIEKLSPGVYKVNHDNILKQGPLVKVLKYCAAANNDESIMSMRYDEQGKLLDMTVDEIKMIWGYLGNYNSFNDYIPDRK
jgi:hypothetical protein